MPSRSRNRRVRIPAIRSDKFASQMADHEGTLLHVGDIIKRQFTSRERKDWEYVVVETGRSTRKFGLTRLVNGKLVGERGQWALWVARECIKTGVYNG